MSRFVGVSLTFESEMSGARSTYNQFVREAESRVIRIPAVLDVRGGGAVGAGASTGAPPSPPPGSVTFAGSNPVPQGTDFVPPPVTMPAPEPIRVREQGMPTAPVAPPPKINIQGGGADPFAAIRQSFQSTFNEAYAAGDEDRMKEIKANARNFFGSDWRPSVAEAKKALAPAPPVSSPASPSSFAAETAVINQRMLESGTPSTPKTSSPANPVSGVMNWGGTPETIKITVDTSDIDRAKQAITSLRQAAAAGVHVGTSPGQGGPIRAAWAEAQRRAGSSYADAPPAFRALEDQRGYIDADYYPSSGATMNGGRGPYYSPGAGAGGGGGLMAPPHLRGRGPGDFGPGRGRRMWVPVGDIDEEGNIGPGTGGSPWPQDNGYNGGMIDPGTGWRARLGSFLGGGPDPGEEGAADFYRQYAFGFIRPLAAGYIFARGMSSYISRVRNIDIEGRRYALTNRYDPLESQVAAGQQFVNRESDAFFAPKVADFLNSGGTVSNYFNRILTAREQSGIFSRNFFRALGGGGTTGQFVGSHALENMSDSANDFRQQQVLNATLKENTLLQIETSAAGMIGFSRERANIIYTQAKDVQELNEKIRQNPRASDALNAQIGLINKRAENQLGLLNAEIGDQIQANIGQSGVAKAQSEGLFFAAQLGNFDVTAKTELAAVNRAALGLPQSQRDDLINSTIRRQQDQRQALIDVQSRADRITNTQLLGQAQSGAATRFGFDLSGAVLGVAARHGAVIDPKTGQLDFPDLDKSAPNYTENFKARSTAYYNDYDDVVAAVQRVRRIQEANIAASTAIARGDPLGAALSRIQGEFEATVGYNPDTGKSTMSVNSPTYQRAQRQRDADTDALYTQFNNQSDLLNLSISTEREALKRRLNYDYIGADLEELTGSYDQRQVELSFDERRKGERIDVLRNERLAVQNFQQNYLDSFRGEALDTRLFDVSNPRDVEDPTVVLKSIDDKLTEVTDLLRDLGVGDED